MKTTTKKNAPISFRLDLNSKRRLQNRADLNGLKVSELVRQLVFDALNEDLVDTEIGQMKMKISSTEQTIKGLRNDVYTAVQALLVVHSKSQSVTPEQASNWVKKNLSTD